MIARIGPLFKVSAINVARAAVREPEQFVPTDVPVDIHVDNYGGM